MATPRGNVDVGVVVIASKVQPAEDCEGGRVGKYRSATAVTWEDYSPSARSASASRTLRRRRTTVTGTASANAATGTAPGAASARKLCLKVEGTGSVPKW